MVTSSPPCLPLRIHLSLALSAVGKVGSQAVRLAWLYLNPKRTFCSSPVFPATEPGPAWGPHSLCSGTSCLVPAQVALV